MTPTAKRRALRQRLAVLYADLGTLESDRADLAARVRRLDERIATVEAHIDAVVRDLGEGDTNAPA